MKNIGYHVMVKPIGPVCNLECKYCYYLDKYKLYPAERNWIMTEETLEIFIRQYIESQDIPEITFHWQGGEPTLAGIEFFKKALSYQKKYANGKHIYNALQTNGTQLDDEWCELFNQNNILVGLSIDGPEDIHNQMRLEKNGSGSFLEVMKGLGLLRKHDIDFNTLTCVHKYNSSYPEVIYKFLKDIGSRFIQFIPIVERTLNNNCHEIIPPYPIFKGESVVADWSVNSLGFGKFLSSIFDQWIRKDVGKYFIQVFDVTLESWLGLKSGLCIFDETCGHALALEHNGDLYSCDHYVFRENYLGNIMQTDMRSLVDSNAQIKFGRNKKGALPTCCKECQFLFACNGGCPKNRFLTTSIGEHGLNYLCEGYKHFFTHVTPYMNFMAHELQNRRPPTNVMKWAKEKDKGFSLTRPGRNDPCPCGSGKKYKNCCMKM